MMFIVWPFAGSAAMLIHMSSEKPVTAPGLRLAESGMEKTSSAPSKKKPWSTSAGDWYAAPV